jgi:hypothetical protein
MQQPPGKYGGPKNIYDCSDFFFDGDSTEVRQRFDRDITLILTDPILAKRGQTRTKADKRGQTRTNEDKRGQMRTNEDKRGQMRTNADKRGQRRFLLLHICIKHRSPPSPRLWWVKKTVELICTDATADKVRRRPDLSGLSPSYDERSRW